MDGSQSEFGQKPPPPVEAVAGFAGQIVPAEGAERPEGNSILNKIRGARSEMRGLLNRTITRLRSMGIPDHIIIAGISRSRRTGAPLVHELVSSNQLDLHAYYCRLANDLGVPFENSINSKRMLPDISAKHFRPGRTVQVCCRDESGGLVLYMAPDIRAENQLFSLFEKTPAMRARFRICDPQTILAAIEGKLAQQSVDAAVNALHERWPHLSAKETLIPWQAFVLGVFVVMLPMFLWFAFWPTLFAIHALSMLLFGASIAVRVAAWLALGKASKTGPPFAESSNYPVYSVLIALHKEAAVVPQLVRAMARLDWPSSRLEVVYICEADDAETLAAFSNIRLPVPHRVLCVPAALPRTKPKALNYALAKSTGDFVVIYDAEDRPHPQQLKEAWSRFSAEPEELACLQSPLEISNPGQAWLSRLFAFEYAAHFHGLLPYLGKIGAPLPLGGTSNHFRRSALVNCLGWDPYNVTEDADLGIRLYRFGYRCGVLKLSTLEDAPVNLRQWIPQRTRWIKGWMQTFLVHNRDYRILNKNIGIRNNLFFQILMVGFIMSPLLYGISIVEIIYFILNLEKNSESSKAILYIDISIFLFGHVGYLLLAFKCWQQVSKQSAKGMAAALPVYWVLASAAAWRAVWKLITAPHQWEKTTHQVAFKPQPKISRSNVS